MPKQDEPSPRDVYIEFHSIGKSVKVSAIDSLTLTEVSIVGPANESPEVLKANVLRKLHYVMNKKSPEKPDNGNFA